MDDFSVEPGEPGPTPRVVLRSIIEPPRLRPRVAVVLALLVIATSALIALLFYTAHQLIYFTE